MKRKLKVAFADFWGSFDRAENFFTKVLSLGFDVEVVDPSQAEVLFYSCFGGVEHYAYTAPIRIYFTGENDVPDFNECDYAISFHHLDFGNRHLRLPLYCVYPEMEPLRTRRRFFDGDPLSRGFCSAVISNSGPHADPFRIEFMNKLNAYKEVASGGGYANNVGGRVADKISFISGYKFNLAFENSNVEGYTTEKILEAFYAGTLPVYWGNSRVNEDFNPHTFINVNDFPDAEAAINYIRTVDSDDELYLSYFREFPLQGNPFEAWEKILLAFLTQAISAGKRLNIQGRVARFYNRGKYGSRFVSNRLVSKFIRILHGQGAETRI